MHQLLRSKPILWAVSILVLVGLVSVAVAIKRNQPIDASKTEEAATSTPITAPTIPEATAKEGIKGTPNVVLELFNPSDASLTQQLNETTIQQNIEQLLSTSFVLSHCGVMDSSDNANIFRASVGYALETHLAKDVPEAVAKIQELTKSAAATYVMLYRNTDCKNPKLKTISEQMVKWETYYLNKHGRIGEPTHETTSPSH